MVKKILVSLLLVSSLCANTEDKDGIRANPYWRTACNLGEASIGFYVVDLVATDFKNSEKSSRPQGKISVLRKAQIGCIRSMPYALKALLILQLCVKEYRLLKGISESNK